MLTSSLNAVTLLAFVHFGYWLAWGGSLVLSVALVVLMWTRWGHSQPLQKCAALSLLVHLFLAFLTMTVRIVVGDGSGGGGSLGGPIHVRLVEDGGKANAAGETGSEVAAPKLLEAAAAPVVAEGAKPQAAKAESEETVAVDAAKATSKMVETAADPTPKIIPDPPANKSKEVATPPMAPPAPAAVTAHGKEAAGSAKVATSPPKAAVDQKNNPASAPSTVSDTYSLRSASGRLSLIEGQGGNAETEAAVVAALNWLANAQSSDGRWNANQFGAGQEQMVLGQDRGGAGRNADTGISALAVLAFLGAGHSHLNGQYHDTIHRGLDFLLRSQAADGSLFGDATLYAQMYCHSMATFALAEAEAMTGDRRLELAVKNAVNFSLAAQNVSSGGWRYRPGDSGDTSQLGWQIMALASAKRAGLSVPDQTWSRIDRFLRNVRRGTYGGLASYRADSPASTSMTAEALYCRLVLEEVAGNQLDDAAETEAANQLLTALPSAERANFYYWYYATLALHHRQRSGEAAAAAWRRWNDAMTAALVSTQIREGNDAGSWDTGSLWGGYGGKIYTTAMATMCLEVYYRYAPSQEQLNARAALRPGTSRPRK